VARAGFKINDLHDPTFACRPERRRRRLALTARQRRPLADCLLRQNSMR
jgi:hypothetical protein